MNRDNEAGGTLAWGPYLMDPAPEKVSFRVAALSALGLCLAVAGSVLVARAMAGLRPALRYREQTGEGIGVIEPGFALTAGGLLVSLSASLLLLASARIARRPALMLRVTSVFLVSGVVGCALAAIWTSSPSG
jgi:hypothetical protein